MASKGGSKALGFLKGVLKFPRLAIQMIEVPGVWVVAKISGNKSGLEIGPVFGNSTKWIYRNLGVFFEFFP